MDAVDGEGQTSLHHAALGGHVEVLRRLVEAGADTDYRDKVLQINVPYNSLEISYNLFSLWPSFWDKIQLKSLIKMNNISE